MGTQRGRNAGITALFDLPGFAALFNCQLFRFAPNLVGQTRPRRGRGGGVWRTVRWMFSSGQIVLTGEMRPDGAPAPDQWKGQTGNVTVQIDVGKTITYPVIVTACSPGKHDENSDEIPNFAATCDIIGPPVYVGFTPGTATDPTKADQEQWEGTSKSTDPKGLQSASTQLIDIWGALADTDIGETSKLAAVIAAAVAPMSGLKVRLATLARDALDGGTVTIQWGLTDTAEDVTNPKSITKVDPQKNTTSGTVAAINATPTIPTVAFQTLVERDTDSMELNDGNLLKTTTFGQRNTTEDNTFPGTWTEADVYNIDTKAQVTEDYDVGSGPPADPTAPTGTQLVSRKIVKLNRDRSERIEKFDVLNAQQRRGFDREHTKLDANNISAEAIRWKVYDEGSTPPSVPDDPPASSANVKIIFFDDIPLRPNAGGVVKQYLRWFLYGPQNTADELVLKNTEDNVDVTNLASTGIRSGLDGDTITDPTWLGFKLRFTKTLTLSRGLTVNRTLTVKLYGTRTTIEDITFENTWIKQDISTIGQLESTAKQTDIYDPEGTVPNVVIPTSQVRRFSRTFKQTDGLTQREVEFGTRTPQQDREFLKSKYVLESGQLDRETLVCKVTASSTPDSTGLNPDTTNLSLYWSESHQETNGGLWEHIFAFRPLTAAEKLTAQHVKDTVDPSSLEDEHTRVIIDTNATAPGDPGVAGQVLHHSWTIRVGKVQYLHVYEYRYRTSAAALVADKTTTETDLSGLRSRAVTAAVWLVSGGAPSDPTLSGYTLRTKADLEVLNPLYRLRVYTWGLRSQQDDIEMPETRMTTESGQIERDEVVVKVQGSSTPDATGLNPDSTNLSLYDIVGHPETNTNKWVFTFRYRPLTPTEKMQEDTAEVVDDPVTSLDGNEIRCIKDTNATTSAPVVGGKVCVRRMTRRVGKVQYKHTFWFDFRSVGDQLEAKQTRTKTDLSTLVSTAQTADVWATGGSPPGDPALAGYVLVEKEDVETENPAYRLRIYTWGLVTTKQRIEYAEGGASAGPLFNYKSEAASVVAWTGTEQALAVSVGGANQNDATFEEVRTKLLTPAYALQKLIRTGEDKSFHSGHATSIVTEVRAKPTGGYNQPDSLIHILGRNNRNDPASGLGIKFGLVERIPLRRHLGGFSLRRRFPGMTLDNLADFFHLDARGKVNGAAFGGYGAHEVLYAGAALQFCGSIGPVHVGILDYIFLTDSWWFMDDSRMPEGQVTVPAGSSYEIPQDGFIDPRNISTNYTMQWPGPWGFDIFLD